MRKNTLKTIFIIAITLFYFGLQASVDTLNSKKKIKATIISFGIYDSEVIERYEAPNNGSGYISLTTSPRLITETVDIPLKKGLSFGFIFEIEGFSNDIFEYSLVANHPPITRHDKIYTTSTIDYSINPNGSFIVNNYITYKFTENFEMVPGDWTLSITSGNEILLSKTFYVAELN